MFAVASIFKISQNVGLNLKISEYLKKHLIFVPPHHLLNSFLAWKLSRNWVKAIFIFYIGLLKTLQKGDVYFKAGYGILSPIFIPFVQMTWKLDIVEGLDASLRYQSFKAQLQYFVCQF